MNDRHINMRRRVFGIIFLLIFTIELLIGMYGRGWVRNSLGDILVIILLYALFRTARPCPDAKWFFVPTAILIFSFAVEFLQLWGICDRLNITNALLRIIIGTGFSVEDLICYVIGSVPCYVTEYLIRADNR